MNLNPKRPVARTEKPDNAKKVFEGVLFNIYQWQQEMFDGSTTTFESLERRDTVTIIPVTEDGKIIMTKQEQPCAGTFWSLPGGIMDPGEEVFVAAKRELMEETGHFSDDWQEFFATQPSGKIDWAAYVFIAKNCQVKSTPTPDAGEKIQLELVNYDRFLELMKEKSFRNHDVVLHYFRMTDEEKDEFRNLLSS